MRSTISRLTWTSTSLRWQARPRITRKVSTSFLDDASRGSGDARAGVCPAHPMGAHRTPNPHRLPFARGPDQVRTGAAVGSASGSPQTHGQIGHAEVFDVLKTVPAK